MIYFLVIFIEHMEAGAGSCLAPIRHKAVSRIVKKPVRVYRPIKHRSALTTVVRLDLAILKCPDAPRKSKTLRRRPEEPLRSLMSTETLENVVMRNPLARRQLIIPPQ